MNKTILIGNAGSEVEFKPLNSGDSVAEVSLATSENYKSGGEWQTKTSWHSLVFWNKQAEKAQKQIGKGSLIALEGKLTYDSWTDDDGKKREKAKIVVLSFKVLNKTYKDEQPQSEPQPKEAPQPVGATESGGDDSDLPF